MRKFLIITDSHGRGIINSTIFYFGLKNINVKEESSTRGKRLDTLTTLIIDDILIEVLILEGSTCFNFFKYLDLLRDKEYTNYHIYAYLGYNDIYPMIDRASEKETSYRYLSNLKEIFGTNITVVFPLKKRNPEAEYSERYLEVYNNFIKNVINDSKVLDIRCVSIYDYLYKNMTDLDYMDEDHLKYDRYIGLVRDITGK